MRSKTGKAFTLIELIVIIAIVVVVALVLVPALARPKRYRHGPNCVNNLKQVGLAFRTWTIDNNDRFPMQVSVISGGTMEYVNRGNAFIHFLVMSNELYTPQVLICPQEDDSNRTMANTFSTTISGGLPNRVPFTSDNHLSYFVGVDAEDAYPSRWLCGDRNLATNGTPLKHGLQSVLTNSVVGWVKPRHERSGNIGLVDGSVQQIANARLGSLLQQTGVTTNRLAIP